MKKIGIVCDNYKIDKFKKEFTKAGYEYTTSPVTKDTTGMFIQVPEATFDHHKDKVQKLCQRLELHFKRGN